MFFGVFAGAATGCNQLPFDPTDLNPGPVQGPGPGANNPGEPVPTPPPTPPTSATQCVSSDANRMCIGLSLVSYRDNAGLPTINQGDAETLVRQMNDIWNTCNIAFQMERYEAVDPTIVGLSYGAASESELYDIRKEFSDSTTFLVAVPGPWTGRTIAWTTMPGGGPFGAIVEMDYGHNPMTVGHELGHYQGLYHVSGTTNLMNAYIGTNTSALTSGQCAIARQTNTDYWQKMLRH